MPAIDSRLGEIPLGRHNTDAVQWRSQARSDIGFTGIGRTMALLSILLCTVACDDESNGIAASLVDRSISPQTLQVPESGQPGLSESDTTTLNANAGESAPDDLHTGFARCFGRAHACIANLMREIPEPDASVSPLLKTIEKTAITYLGATSDDDAALSWTAFIEALETYQTGPGLKAGTSAAQAPVVVPDGDFVAGCASWTGHYRDVGSYATAEDQGYRGVMTFKLRCPGGDECGSHGNPYLAEIELSEASPDGVTGTGSWYRFNDIPMITAGNLLVAYTARPLYHELAQQAGSEEWCEHRKPPCYMASASAGDVLFSIMLSCSSGSGVLQWGALADEAL